MNIDFKLAEQVKKEVLQISGWVYPLEVEHGFYRWATEIYLVWRVTGAKLNKI